MIDIVPPLVESWFEVADPPCPYQTIQEEICAVIDGRKAIATYSLSLVGLSDAEHHDLVEIGLRGGLSVVYLPSGEDPSRHFRVFFCSKDASWRAHAFNELWRAWKGPWTHSAERLSSSLLGYTDQQIVEWMEYVEWRRVAWGGPTVYVLMDRQQRLRTADLGYRALGSTGSGVTLVHPGDETFGARREAFRQLPDGVHLGRVTMRFFDFQALSRDRPAQPMSLPADMLVFDEVDMPELNRAVASGVQFLSSDGWGVGNV